MLLPSLVLYVVIVSPRKLAMYCPISIICILDFKPPAAFMLDVVSSNYGRMTGEKKVVFISSILEVEPQI
jgi:hypothetical protein